MKSGTWRKLVAALIVLVVAAFLPGLVLAAIGWSTLAGIASLGAVSAFVAAVQGGRRVGFLLALPLAVASALAVSVSFASSAWLAAVLMFVVAAARGLTATRGLHVPLSMAVITVGFAVSEPPRTDEGPPIGLLVGLAILAAALYGAGVVALLGKRLPHLKPLEPVPPGRARLFALTSGLLMAVATWFVVHLDLGHTGAWLLLTIVIVLQPYVQDGFQKSVQRAGGTILGFVVAIVIGSLISMTAILYLIGMVAIGAAMLMLFESRPYWMYAACLTTAVVMLEGASTSIDETAERRLLATIIGAAAALLVTLAARPLAKRAADRRGLTHY